MMEQHNCYGLTDIGLRRESNQDSFLVGNLSKSLLVAASSLSLEPGSRLFGDVYGWLLMVADGMGGHAGGERASSLAIQYLAQRLLTNIHWMVQINPAEEAEFVASLSMLLRDTHHEIQSESQRDHSLSGMGTTLTMAYLTASMLYVVHAGDSRCYRVRDGHVQQITTDHTMARRLVESGGMAPEEESTSRWSNVLWNVLGGKSADELKVDVHQIDLRGGDWVLVCSDGLHRYLDSNRILSVLESGASCQQACQQFIELAKAGGGEDNITAVVAEVPAGDDSVLVSGGIRQDSISLSDTVDIEIPYRRRFDQP